MKFRAFSLILSLIALMACGGHIGVSSRNCISDKGQWSIDTIDHRPDFTIKESLSIIRGKHTPILLKDVLEKKEIQCGDVQQIKVTLKQTWKDILLSLFPPSVRYTLIVEGLLGKNQLQELRPLSH